MSYTDKDKSPENAADPYMGLRGGRKMYLLRPDPQVYDPYLDAESLACEARYGGNYGQYSVAQHSVLVARVTEELWHRSNPKTFGCGIAMRGALWHEGSEAITGDMPQPVKSLCPEFKALENRLQAVCDIRYGIDSKLDIIKEADRIVFAAEIRRIVPRQAWELYGFYGDPTYRTNLQPSARDLVIWSPDRAAKEMIYLHEQLS